MDGSQESGMLQAENSPRAEVAIDDDTLRPEFESEEDTFGREVHPGRLADYRYTVVSFFEDSAKVYSLLRLTTLTTLVLCLFSMAMNWGVYMSALGLINNAELLISFRRENSAMVANKASFYICRCVVLIMLKPLINVVICMLGGNLCWFSSPSHIGAELPLMIAMASVAQVMLLRVNRDLAAHDQQANY